MSAKRLSAAEVLRELGKDYFFHSDGDRDKRNLGLRFLKEAYYRRDPEASYLIAYLILHKVLAPCNGDAEMVALSLLHYLSKSGYGRAKMLLDQHCLLRYKRRFADSPSMQVNHDGLVDYNGKRIRIKRKGIFAPVKAVLEQRKGQNVLTISLNVMFLFTDELDDPELFKRSVINGMKSWEGIYSVFGGQKLKVDVRVTTEDRLFGSLFVLPVVESFESTTRSMVNAVATRKRKALLEDIFTNKRSFAISGLKWSVVSLKMIYMMSRNGRFDNYEELLHIAKHEFGHSLGLGDLYCSEVDRYPGVPMGTYPELDCYAISDKVYNLVMCDGEGLISNNDIEMVLLAFRDNKIQLYQTRKRREKVSAALGRGN